MSGDNSYNAKNYEKQGGAEWDIGGTLRICTGGAIVPDSGTIAGAITNVPTGLSADPAANATAINSILAALRGVGIIAAA